ncbi:hypothetical protein SDC9_168900 [bioreactor metagenome]|uniref:Uncharacterized protein n=1 Tax=bioreactor metagenome TaxID=1076179 RepID=A0A645G6E7_9ZZZZ
MEYIPLWYKYNHFLHSEEPDKVHTKKYLLADTHFLETTFRKDIYKQDVSLLHGKLHDQQHIRQKEYTLFLLPYRSQ